MSLVVALSVKVRIYVVTFPIWSMYKKNPNELQSFSMISNQTLWNVYYIKNNTMIWRCKPTKVRIRLYDINTLQHRINCNTSPIHGSHNDLLICRLAAIYSYNTERHNF